MGAKHTDAPWEIESDEEGEYLVGSDGECLAIFSNDVMDDEQSAADRRLMTAAPKLLAASKALLDVIAEGNEIAREMQMDNAVQALSDAIEAAEAEGRTP